MTVELKASNYMRAIGERLKPGLHGGLRLSSDEAAVLLRQINTAAELAHEMEDELKLVNAALHARVGGKPSLKIIEGGAT